MPPKRRKPPRHYKRRPNRPRPYFLWLPARPGELFVNLLDLPLEHFRKYVRLSEWQLPPIDPEDRDRVDDHDLVRATVRDFDELADLSDEDRERLVADIVIAIWAWRAGVDIGKHGLSNEKEAIHIFISNVGRALGRVGQHSARWRKRYEGDGGPDPDAPESFYFRLVRELGDAFGIPIPTDLMLATKRASEIQYEMSPAMKVEQLGELIAQGRQRLGDLAVRLHRAEATALAVPESRDCLCGFAPGAEAFSPGLVERENLGGLAAPIAAAGDGSAVAVKLMIFQLFWLGGFPTPYGQEKQA